MCLSPKPLLLFRRKEEVGRKPLLESSWARPQRVGVSEAESDILEKRPAWLTEDVRTRRVLRARVELLIIWKHGKTKAQ